MKKIISLLLAVVILNCGVLTAFAADTEISSDGDIKSGTTNITYHIDSSYIVNIPEVIEANDSAYHFTASKMDLCENECVEIKLSGLDEEGKLTLAHPYKSGEIYVYAYVPGSYEIVPNYGTVATFGDGATESMTELHFKVDGMSGDISAGEYSGTVTFDVNLTTMEF